MRSILRFVFVVIPTAVLGTAVVVGVSRNGQGTAATSDGDLQQDLKLASATTLELAPAGRPLATVSSIEAPPAATPERTLRPKRSSSGTRAARSRAPVVRAAAEPEVAEAAEEPQTTEVAELAGEATGAAAEAPAPGGVALPRPTAIPVIFPTDGADAGTHDPGPGSVIRGGVLDGDHCQIHGRGGRGGRIYGPPIYRQPRGTTVSLGDRVRAAGRPSGEARGSSIGGRARAAQGRSGSQGSSRGGSLGDRVRAARGR